MRKTLLCSAFIAVLSFTGVASAQTEVYSVTEATVVSDGQAVVNVQYSGETAEAGAQVMQGVIDTAAMPPAPPQPPRPGIRNAVQNTLKQLPPVPARETNKQLIERIRKAKQNGDIRMQMKNGAQSAGEVRFEQHVNSQSGTTSLPAQAGGEIRVYRQVNGVLVEDQTIKIPKGVPGKPVFFRASTTNSSGTPPMRLRELNASNTRAMVVRAIASSTGVPWLEHMPFFSQGVGRVVSTTSADGNVVFSFEQKRPQIRAFMESMFGLFKKVAPQVDQQFNQ